MLLRMGFCGFLRVVGRIQMMPMSNVGVMSCRFVIALFVTFGGFSMMLRSFLMMFLAIVGQLYGIERAASASISMRPHDSGFGRTGLGRSWRNWIEVRGRFWCRPLRDWRQP